MLKIQDVSKVAMYSHRRQFEVWLALNNLSQAQVAEMLGTHQPTIGHTIRGSLVNKVVQKRLEELTGINLTCEVNA